MRIQSRSIVVGMMMAVSGAVGAALAFWVAGIPAAGQAPTSPGQFAPYQAPRTPDGRPDLNGIWQAFTTANWNVLEHEAQPGPHPGIMGVYGAGPAGLSIVEGNEIPYQPWAKQKQQENLASRMVVRATGDTTQFETGDPELKCYRPGVPRATYMPFPFQIFQTPEQIMVVYEFKNAARTIYLTDEFAEGPGDFWMGWSHGRWEGDTLVVDVKRFHGYTWFDRAGNFHSSALHVVERYTPVSPYHLMYEATIEDPNVFTRPWKMSFPLYRRMESNIQLLDFNCVPFVEEIMYGELY